MIWRFSHTSAASNQFASASYIPNTARRSTLHNTAFVSSASTSVLPLSPRFSFGQVFGGHVEIAWELVWPPDMTVADVTDDDCGITTLLFLGERLLLETRAPRGVASTVITVAGKYQVTAHLMHDFANTRTASRHSTLLMVLPVSYTDSDGTIGLPLDSEPLARAKCIRELAAGGSVSRCSFMTSSKVVHGRRAEPSTSRPRRLTAPPRSRGARVSISKRSPRNGSVVIPQSTSVRSATVISGGHTSSHAISTCPPKPDRKPRAEW